MPKKIFFSFHYQPDNWRAAQVRNIGTVDGSAVASDNDWESIKNGGDPAIQRWIDAQIAGRSCGIVLIGSATAGRKWIEYEIKKCWDDGKGLLGIHIHNLKDRNGQQTYKGANPFSGFTVKSRTVPLTNYVTAYDPPYISSTDVYAYIENNLEGWINTAILTRANFK